MTAAHRTELTDRQTKLFWRLSSLIEISCRFGHFQAKLFFIGWKASYSWEFAGGIIFWTCLFCGGVFFADLFFHSGRAPRNKRMQIMEPVAVNGSGNSTRQLTSECLRAHLVPRPVWTGPDGSRGMHPEAVFAPLGFPEQLVSPKFGWHRYV